MSAFHINLPRVHDRRAISAEMWNQMCEVVERLCRLDAQTPINLDQMGAGALLSMDLVSALNALTPQSNYTLTPSPTQPTPSATSPGTTGSDATDPTGAAGGNTTATGTATGGTGGAAVGATGGSGGTAGSAGTGSTGGNGGAAVIGTGGAGGAASAGGTTDTGGVGGPGVTGTGGTGGAASGGGSSTGTGGAGGTGGNFTGGTGGGATGTGSGGNTGGAGGGFTGDGGTGGVATGSSGGPNVGGAGGAVGTVGGAGGAASGSSTGNTGGAGGGFVAGGGNGGTGTGTGAAGGNGGPATITGGNGGNPSSGTGGTGGPASLVGGNGGNGQPGATGTVQGGTGATGQNGGNALLVGGTAGAGGVAGSAELQSGSETAILTPDGKLTAPFFVGDGSNLTNLPSGSGTVTHTAGALTAGKLVVGNGAADITVGDLSGDVTTSGSTATTLANTAVTAGSYTNASITVDAKGRLTAASSGSGGSDFVKAGASHAHGLVPDPGSTAHTPPYALADDAAFHKLVATKGDLLVTDGTSLNQLAVGSNNQVLTADSTQTNGVKWAAAGGGTTGTNAQKSISLSDYTTTGSAATITDGTTSLSHTLAAGTYLLYGTVTVTDTAGAGLMTLTIRDTTNSVNVFSSANAFTQLAGQGNDTMCTPIAIYAPTGSVTVALQVSGPGMTGGATIKAGSNFGYVRLS